MTIPKICFKQRVCNTVSSLASPYYDYFVKYDYLLCSPAFKKRPYYIVSAEKNNYQHLTGVSYASSAEDFFDRCLDGTLTEADISFSKSGRSEAEIKGSVRRKINSLPSIIGIFSGPCSVEEDFSKNRIFCSFAAANTACTLGFTFAANTKPMTLLNGNQLKDSSAKPLTLVLRRKRRECFFTDMIIGDEEALSVYLSESKEILSDHLKSMISTVSTRKMP